jgi:hypothetical protein
MFLNPKGAKWIEPIKINNETIHMPTRDCISLNGYHVGPSPQNFSQSGTEIQVWSGNWRRQYSESIAEPKHTEAKTTAEMTWSSITEDSLLYISMLGSKQRICKGEHTLFGLQAATVFNYCLLGIDIAITRTITESRYKKFWWR